jgi:hypothetical protein
MMEPAIKTMTLTILPPWVSSNWPTPWHAITPRERPTSNNGPTGTFHLRGLIGDDRILPVRVVVHLDAVDDRGDGRDAPSSMLFIKSR